MLDTSKMESFNAHCPDNQAANTLPLSTHCGLPDGMLVHAPLCTRLTKALAFAPESLRCQGSRQFGPSDRHVHGERTKHARQPDGAQAQPSLPVSQALAPCARQPGFRARRQALIFAPESTLHESRHALGEPLHISILAAHYAPV